MTTLALFGGSGRTGRLVLDEALAAGYTVRVLARRAASIAQTSPSLTVIEGDVLDPAAVGRTLDGSDAVISVFGQVKGSSPTLQADGTRIITEGMRKRGIRRIVTLSGGGLPYPEQDRPKVPDRLIRFLLQRISGHVLADAEAHLEVLKASGLDWTVVRGPVLTDAPKTGAYRVGWVGVNAGTRIGRADLAEFILGQVDDTRFVHQLPFVST